MLIFRVANSMPFCAQVRCTYYGKILPIFGLNEAPNCSGCT